MAHELDMSNGKAAIAYRGDVPWHGYGDVIGENDSLETIRKKAGLDWEVKATQSQYQVDGETLDFDNRVILYRSDNKKALSQVSASNYKVRQPAEILEFFRELTTANEFQIEVAGALHEGRKVWALASRKDSVGSIGKDYIKPYILLVDSYDGTHATTARWTSVRVVCQNTLSFSAVDKATQVKQKHSQHFDIDRMHDGLGEFDEGFKAYMESLRAMSKVKFTDKMMERFFARIYAPDAFEDVDSWRGGKMDYDKVSTNKKNNIADLLNLVSDNPGGYLPSASGTLYGALQTVTYFQDHEARTKGDKRWESATIGNGNRTKDEAFDLAMQLMAA